MDPVAPSPTKKDDQEKQNYQTGFVRWRADDNGFAGWSLSGVKLNTNGEIEFLESTATSETDPYEKGTYNGRNYYNGDSFFVGEAISPVFTSAFDYKQAIPSWNAATPPGTWIEIQIRAQFGERWSKWFILGIWAEDYSTIQRHSVKGQEDADGTVSDDTFVAKNNEVATNKFQLKLRLFSADGKKIAKVRNVSVSYSKAIPPSADVAAGNSALWNTLLDVPPYSQMVYPDGGNVWCSPTSVSMVLAFWNKDTSPCEPRVRAAVAGVYDWVFDGHGNWPFNAAYGYTQGFEAYIARFTSLTQAEEYIAAGVPVIMSAAWKEGELTNPATSSTNGHLLVLVGFDEEGNLIVNDPAAPTDAGVRRTYLRSEFEPLWLKSSGGTVYLIYPEGMKIPVTP